MTDDANDANVELAEYRACEPIDGLEDLNDALPAYGPLHAFTWYARQAGKLSPPAFLIGAFLPALAHEAARRGYRWGRNKEVPRIQTVLVAPGAAGKSTAMRLAQNFYRDGLRATQGQHYKEPYVIAEGSIPGLMELLSTRYDARTQMSPGLLVLEEFSRLLGARDSVSEVLNQLFDGVTIERALRGYQQMAAKGEKPPNVIRDPAVSALFATTFAGLEETTTSMHRSGGFFSRFLWFTGDPGEGTLDPDPAINARTSAGTVWTGWSAAVDAREVVGADAKLLSLDPKCKPYLQQLMNDANAALKRDSEDPLNPMRMRAAIHAQQVACLYAFSRGELVATDDDAWRAVNLVRYCLKSIAKASQRWRGVDDGTAATVLPRADELYELIEATGVEGLTRGSVYRPMRVTKVTLDELLRLLIDQDRIQELRVPGAGRTSTRFRALVHAPSQNKRGTVLEFKKKDDEDTET